MGVFVGLSGGIGSGKSTVGDMLRELGAALVDADAIVHELQEPGQPMLAEIARHFGRHVITRDGSLDRAALAEVVFQDPEARAALGQLVHPPVIAEMLRRAAQAREAGTAVVVLDIPLLFEGRRSGTGASSKLDFHATIAVWVPRELQIARTMARDGCSREEAERRLAAQLPLDEKRTMADHVIDNSGERHATRGQVEDVYAQLAAQAGAGPG